MKKVTFLFAVLISLSAVAATPPEVTEKIERAFKATFAQAENVNWLQMDEKYQACFTISEVQVRAVYDTEGKLLQTIKYYDESKLPSIILAKLKANNPGKEVFGVTEVATDVEISYHIVLKCEKNWYWMKSDPLGNMELTQKLKRGEPREKSAF